MALYPGDIMVGEDGVVRVASHLAEENPNTRFAENLFNASDKDNT